MTDQEIIDGCLRGRRKAQELLYNRYGGKLFGVCLRYTKNRMEAEDVLQDGFVKIFKKIESYKNLGDQSLFFWMRRIMVNTALNFLRDQKAFRFTMDISPIEESYSENDIWDSDEILNILNTNEVLDIVQRLPDGYRTVFNLYAFEGYSHAEIGESLGISENTSKTQLFKARKSIIAAIESTMQKKMEFKTVI